MAFSLKKLTPKQQEQFVRKQIENPLSPASGCSISACIADTEKNVNFCGNRNPIGIIRMRNCSFCIGGRGR